MRQPSILDVMAVVRRLAPTHSDVKAWWYAPPQRLRLAGARTGSDAPRVEIVIEPRAESRVDRGELASELRIALRMLHVSVREHRGPSEDRRLFRLMSAQERRSSFDGREEQPR